MLKLKLQYFGHLVRRVDSLEKTLMLEGIGGRRRRGQQRMRWLDGYLIWVNSGSWWWTGRSGVLQFMGSQRVRHNWDWTELKVWRYAPNLTFWFSPFSWNKVAFSTLWSRVVWCSSGAMRLGIRKPSFEPSWASLVSQLVKNLPAMWETWIWSLGWEDPLEKGKATHSSILAWKISWTV